MTGVWFCAVVDQSAPIIFGPVGLVLSEQEATFYKQAKPFGFILFQRNCDTVAQVQNLTAQLRESVGWHCPILIDQEGGRVARMKPPVWDVHPAAAQGGSLMVSDPGQGRRFIHESLTALSTELVEVGVDVNCLPVLDVIRPGETDNVIGDRAYGCDPSIVSACGEVACRSLLASGVTPVIKHLPGHGGARCDTHKALASVALSDADLQPFLHVVQLGLPLWGMVAHLLIEDVDDTYPSSLSPIVVQDIIREGLGFDGLLLSDDLSMGALNDFGGEAACAKACLNAGLDIALHCNGTVDEMRAVMDSLPAMREDTHERIASWMSARA